MTRSAPFRNLSRTATLALLSCAHTAVACTREEAFNRMMALNQYNMTLQATLPDPLKDPVGYEARRPRVTDFATRLAAVGKTLAERNFDAACRSYDALATDYGVDYRAQNVRPLSALEGEAKHPPTDRCDLAEAARRSVALTQAFQQRARDAQLPREDWQRFGKDSEPVGLLMQQDPAKACALIDDLAKTYRLPRP